MKYKKRQLKITLLQQLSSMVWWKNRGSYNLAINLARPLRVSQLLRPHLILWFLFCLPASLKRPFQYLFREKIQCLALDSIRIFSWKPGIQIFSPHFLWPTLTSPWFLVIEIRFRQRFSRLFRTPWRKWSRMTFFVL